MMFDLRRTKFTLTLLLSHSWSVHLYLGCLDQDILIFVSSMQFSCNHYTVSCYNNYLGCLDQDILIFRFLYAVFKVHGLIITTVSPRAQNKVFRSRIFSEYPSASLQTSMLKQAWQGCLQAASAALIIIKWRIRDSNSWPPACKAGALPTELIPRVHGLKWTRTTDLTLIRRAL